MEETAGSYRACRHATTKPPDPSDTTAGHSAEASPWRDSGVVHAPEDSRRLTQTPGGESCVTEDMTGIGSVVGTPLPHEQDVARAVDGHLGIEDVIHDERGFAPRRPSVVAGPVPV
jgi:hypothetical protein